MSDPRPGLVFITGPESEVRARAIANHNRFEYVPIAANLTNHPWQTQYVARDAVETQEERQRRRLRNTAAYLGRFTKLLVALEIKDDPDMNYVVATDLFDPSITMIDEDLRNIMTPVLKGLRRRYRVSYVWIDDGEYDARRDPTSERYDEKLICEDNMREGVFFTTQNEHVFRTLSSLVEYYDLHLQVDTITMEEIKKIAEESGLDKVWRDGQEDHENAFYDALNDILDDLGIEIDGQEPKKALGVTQWLDPNFKPEQIHSSQRNNNLDENQDIDGC